jgi:hypothetical protein
MSTSYHILCSSCMDTCSRWWDITTKAGIEDLKQIVRNPLLFIEKYDCLDALLINSEIKIMLQWGAYALDIEWLRQHYTHKLIVIDEYQRIQGD